MEMCENTMMGYKYIDTNKYMSGWSWAPSERAWHHLKGKLSLHEVSSHPVFRVSILLILQHQINKGKKRLLPQVRLAGSSSSRLTLCGVPADEGV